MRRHRKRDYMGLVLEDWLLEWDKDNDRFKLSQVVVVGYGEGILIQCLIYSVSQSNTCFGRASVLNAYMLCIDMSQNDANVAHITRNTLCNWFKAN